MVIKIRLPKVPAGLLGNLLGLFGLIGACVAVGGLTGDYWWSLLTGGIFAVALAYVAQTHETAVPASAPVSVPIAPVQSAPEPASAAA